MTLRDLASIWPIFALFTVMAAFLWWVTDHDWKLK